MNAAEMEPSDLSAGTTEDMGYKEYPPPEAFRSHLVCLWTSTGGVGTGLVLPDSAVDIVFVGDTPPFVAGPDTRPKMAPAPVGAPITGIRFRPGVAPSWLGVSASDIRDRSVPLSQLWGQDAEDLGGRVAEGGAPRGRLRVATALLAARKGRLWAPDPLIGEAARRLARGDHRGISSLAWDLGVGERGLLRRMERRVGYGPKTLERILRLQRFLWLAEQRPSPSLADLALEAGYADQAHMSREVKRLSGCSPSRLLSGDRRFTLELSDLFKT